ncbi:hypothetical protein PPL_04312 [Heterostelium album PN500]|uniref:Uncharacterized protein n=1 Tax=Heterostelium pallidum (strain ATCC 26659 / Pp 5 / PN500) TaxID=670386 RepID=D3B777_HETP5|nr:hypothetical protein PPL_04312 [Heterostelium album PN500]EFA82620.1 hypothetical protein PPL_04312 [Heterostelium album PN500]|eukprot:XP_020434737.1 hypothetical protein PPL_04312 [Heterostelium album PN500]
MSLTTTTATTATTTTTISIGEVNISSGIENIVVDIGSNGTTVGYLSMIKSSALVNSFINYAYNTSVFSLSFIAFFIFGWIYFLKILFRDYEVKLVTVQLSFSMMFALSCTMFELIIFEIMDIMDRDWRYMCWEFDLIVMLIDLILILPYYQFYLIFSSNGSKLRTHILSSLSLCGDERAEHRVRPTLRNGSGQSYL